MCRTSCSPKCYNKRHTLPIQIPMDRSVANTTTDVSSVWTGASENEKWQFRRVVIKDVFQLVFFEMLQQTTHTANPKSHGSDCSKYYDWCFFSVNWSIKRRNGSYRHYWGKCLKDVPFSERLQQTTHTANPNSHEQICSKYHNWCFFSVNWSIRERKMAILSCRNKRRISPRVLRNATTNDTHCQSKIPWLRL